VTVLFGLFFAAVLAFGISAVAGGGASLLLVPLLGTVLAPASVPAALSIGTGASSVSRIAVFRTSIRWDVTAWFVPAAVPLAIAGALLLRFLNPAYVQVVMALVLLSNVPELLRRPQEPQKSAHSRLAIVAIGGAAGFLSGLTGAVGVLFNRFYLRHGLSKQEIVATRATNEVLIHVAKLAVYGSLGLMDVAAVQAGLVVAAGAVASSLLLKPLLGRLSHALFAKIGYAAMVVSGAALFVSSVSRVIRDDRIAIDYRPVVDGADARIHWRDSNLTLEVEYDGGIEVELDIPFSELSPKQQAFVTSLDPGADHIATEVVYEAGHKYYEAYYLARGRLLKKISFDADGRLLEASD